VEKEPLHEALHECKSEQDHEAGKGFIDAVGSWHTNGVLFFRPFSINPSQQLFRK